MQIKLRALFEPDYKNPLPLLRHPRRRADHSGLHMIAKLVAQHVHDRGKGFALVMALKVLDVFEHESRKSGSGFL